MSPSAGKGVSSAVEAGCWSACVFVAAWISVACLACTAASRRLPSLSGDRGAAGCVWHSAPPPAPAAPSSPPAGSPTAAEGEPRPRSGARYRTPLYVCYLELCPQSIRWVCRIPICGGLKTRIRSSPAGRLNVAPVCRLGRKATVARALLVRVCTWSPQRRPAAAASRSAVQCG